MTILYRKGKTSDWHLPRIATRAIKRARKNRQQYEEAIKRGDPNSITLLRQVEHNERMAAIATRKSKRKRQLEKINDH